MKKSVSFRRAVPSDAPLWSRTRQKAWAATYRGIYPDEWIDQYDLETYIARDAQKLSDPKIQSYLVMDGAVCAGYFSYGPTDAGEFCLHTLYLLPEYQRQGIGTQIFRQLAEDCRAAGYTAFYNHCNYHNTSGRIFYEKMGGKLAGDNGFHENRAEDQCRYEYDFTKGEQPWLTKQL